MNLHLVEIAATVAPGAHAVLLVDQAGWHLSTGLVVPPNITIMALPPKCPELNPVENVWQFLREQLAVEPCLQILRRSRRPLLCGVEQARQSALANHVHRIAPMGAPVLINGTRY
jgi:transposase